MQDGIEAIPARNNRAFPVEIGGIPTKDVFARRTRTLPRILSAALLLVLICSLLGGCSKPPENLVFAWTEGYLASPAGEERTFTMTFYSKNSHVLDQIDDIYIEGLNVLDSAAQYRVEKTDLEKEKGYRAYALTCTYTPEQTGCVQCGHVTIRYNGGASSVSVPFGRLDFEAGEPDSGTVDTWESVGSFSDSTGFPYSYTPEDSGTILTQVRYAPTFAAEDPAGLDPAGRISLEDAYDAPVVLILSRVTSWDGQQYAVSYGKGCYCGAVGADSSILEASLNHWNTV